MLPQIVIVFDKRNKKVFTQRKRIEKVGRSNLSMIRLIPGM